MKSGIKSVKRWAAFVVVFLIVNLIWLLSSEKFGSLDPGNLILFIPKQIIAVLVAYVISRIFPSRKAVCDLLLPLTNWRVKPIWYCIALLVFPLFIVLEIILAVLLKALFPAEYYST